MKVWLVESVDYEQSSVLGAYSSREGAIAGHKATYPEVTDWREDDDYLAYGANVVRIFSEDLLDDGQPWYVKP